MTDGQRWTADTLPSELLVEIFGFATYSTIRDLQTLINSSTPFEYIGNDATNASIIAALRTKCTLSLTSKRWRALSARYLYEEICVRNLRSDAILADVLEASAFGTSLGSHVKRIYFRRSVNKPRRLGTNEPGSAVLRIIRCCPKVRIISRDRDLLDRVTRVKAGRFSDPYSFDKISEEISRLGALVERVDLTFGNLALGSLNHCFGFSPGICCNFSSLRMLSISMDVPIWSKNPEELGFKHAQLSNLHTLRLLRSHMREVVHVKLIEFPPVVLPALRRLIVSDVHHSHYRTLLEANAERVHVFEFDASPGERGWYLQYANLAYPLSICPNLEELYFPILVVTTRVDLDLVATVPEVRKSRRIRHVGLHATAFEQLKLWGGYDGGYQVYHKGNEGGDPTCYEEWEWKKLEEQFAFIGTFECLENITFYGSDWKAYVGDSRFLQMIESITAIGITVHADEKVVKDLLHASCSNIRVQ